MQTLVDRHRQLLDDAITNWKPVEFTQDKSDVVKTFGKYQDVIRCGALTIDCYQKNEI